MGIVNESVEDGIGKGGIGHGFVPVRRRELARHDGGSTLVPVIEQFEQVSLLGRRERREAPVVEYEDVEP
jgi:hypothetical protein